MELPNVTHKRLEDTSSHDGVHYPLRFCPAEFKTMGREPLEGNDILVLWLGVHKYHERLEDFDRENLSSQTSQRNSWLYRFCLIYRELLHFLFVRGTCLGSGGNNTFSTCSLLADKKREVCVSNNELDIDNIWTSGAG